MSPKEADAPSSGPLANAASNHTQPAASIGALLHDHKGSAEPEPHARKRLRQSTSGPQGASLATTSASASSSVASAVPYVAATALACASSSVFAWRSFRTIRRLLARLFQPFYISIVRPRDFVLISAYIRSAVSRSRRAPRPPHQTARLQRSQRRCSGRRGCTSCAASCPSTERSPGQTDPQRSVGTSGYQVNESKEAQVLARRFRCESPVRRCFSRLFLVRC
jgi:hypothetical protein